MAEYRAEPEEKSPPRLRLQLTPGGMELIADVCVHCGSIVVWNPKAVHWEHYQTWEVACSDAAIKAKRQPARNRIILPSNPRMN